MGKPLSKLLIITLITLGLHFLLYQVLPEDAKRNETLSYALSLLGNVIASFMFVWILLFMKQIETAPAEEGEEALSSKPALWSHWTAIGVLAGITLTAALLSQTFVDAVWYHAQQMVEAQLLTPDGKKRIGIYFLGLVPMMVWAPLVTYASLSVGRRAPSPPTYGNHIIATVIGLGAVVAWNTVSDLRMGLNAPLWQIMPHIPGDTPSMRIYDNLVGYAVQFGTLTALVLFYSGWTKIWTQIGWFLHRKGIA